MIRSDKCLVLTQCRNELFYHDCVCVCVCVWGGGGGGGGGWGSGGGWRKMGGGSGQMGGVRGQKSEFWAGVPEKNRGEMGRDRGVEPRG